jgi:hypothetical protein
VWVAVGKTGKESLLGKIPFWQKDWYTANSIFWDLFAQALCPGS